MFGKQSTSRNSIIRLWLLAVAGLIFLMVVVGGSGYFFGPYLGAIVAVLLPEWLRFTEGYYLMAYAVLVIALMVVCPAGLLGLVERITKPRSGAVASDRTPMSDR